MRNLTSSELSAVTGGERGYIITSKITPTGISEGCLNGLVATLNGPSISDEQAAIKILSVCKFTELDLLGELIENAPVIKMELIGA